ncbi:isochorismatase family protein [Paenibacillus solisilvae]|uniref:Isochorismatase family protein n=1 Tax=Paenibacillus solisilvae TaxID=2486751 RepID=A0ABW0VX43_9BACL
MYEGDVLLGRLRDLIAKARRSGIPVIYIQHNEGEGAPLATNTAEWRIHPEVAPEPNDRIIQKYKPDSFDETNLQQVLSANGIQKLVMTGIQTDVCVAATCRRASELGYEVLVVQDAHSTWNQGELKAAEIIKQYNDLFASYASTTESAGLEFVVR